MKAALLLFLTFSLFSCHHRPVLKSGLEGTIIPTFDLLLTDSMTHFSTAKITGGRPTVFFFFSPECPYCRAQMQDLIDNSKELKGIHFILVTEFPFKEMIAFYTHYKLNQYLNITLGEDYSGFFSEYFKTTQVPFLALYNKERRLNQVNLGKMYSQEIKTIAFE